MVRPLFNITLIICFFVVFSHGQDNLPKFKEAVITGKRQSPKGEKFDTLKVRNLVNYNLDKLLEAEPGFYIRKLSPQGSASFTYRGTSPAQNQLVWNGFVINSPQLGSADLSLIPNLGLNNLSLLKGGEANLLSGGAIGATLAWQSMIHDKPKTDFGCFAGSFGLVGYNLSTSFGDSLLKQQIIVGYRRADNGFSIPKVYDNQELTVLTNADIRSQFFQYNARLRFCKGWTWSQNFWFQQVDRGISPGILTISSLDRQKDKSFRSVSTIEKPNKFGILRLKSALFFDYLGYQQRPTKAINISSKSESFNYNGLAEFHSFRWNGHQMEGQLSSQTIIVRSQQLIGSQLFDNGIKASLGYNFQKGDWESSASIRSENWNNSFLPTQFFIKQSYNKTLSNKNLQLFSQVGNTIRRPTLNDRFWYPYGNLNLESEKALNINAGIKLKSITNYTNLVIANLVECELFSSNVQNWILWQQSGNGRWRASNIESVQLNGIQLGWKADLTIRRVTFSQRIGLSRSFSMVNSIDVNSTQLPFLPEWQGSYNGSFAWNNWTLSSNWQWQGIRYTTSDNSSNLPSYTLLDLAVQKKISIKNFSSALKGELNNVFNEVWFVYPYQPMLPRNFQIALFLSI